MRLGNPSEHLTLTRTVARAMGIDLTVAVGAAALEPSEFANMITQCRGCACVAECQTWLAAQDRFTSKAPANCPNAPILERLAAK